jgi:hypothetical protein
MTKRKVSTSSREHRERRKALKVRVDQGVAACVACGQRIRRHERWEVHYLDDGTHGPRHHRCRARLGIPMAPPAPAPLLERRTSRIW